MRIVFFGSGEIAINCLEFLIREKQDVICVVTAPDRKKGRHLITFPTPVKEVSEKYGLDIFQPANLFSRDSIEYFKKLAPDIFVVFSFGRILSQELLAIPKMLAINIHASLLPKYRGAAPINWALIKGETKTGITIIRMNERMDEGEIILKKELPIDNSDTAATLEDKLARLAPQALKEALLGIERNETQFLKQDIREVSFAPKLRKEDGRINWNNSALQIRNQLRGCLLWPGTFTFYKDKFIKIWDVEIKEVEKREKFSPGAIIAISREGLLVATADKHLLIKELQPASSKRMTAEQFLLGHKIEKGEKLT